MHMENKHREYKLVDGRYVAECLYTFLIRRQSRNRHIVDYVGGSAIVGNYKRFRSSTTWASSGKRHLNDLNVTGKLPYISTSSSALSTIN